MKNIKNFKENNKQEIQDPLTILWGIYNSEIASTGRIDSEFDSFKKIEKRFLSNQISAQDLVKEAWAIVNGRLEYN